MYLLVSVLYINHVDYTDTESADTIGSPLDKAIHHYCDGPEKRQQLPVISEERAEEKYLLMSCSPVFIQIN